MLAAANDSTLNSVITVVPAVNRASVVNMYEPYYAYGEHFAELTCAWVLGVGCSTAVVLNSIVIATLLVKRNSLLTQAPAVYVLSGAIANILSAGPAGLVEMADFHLKGRWHFPACICFMRMMADYVGSYITSSNTAFVCWDRYRIVSQGAKYSQERETRRAWYFVSLQTAGSIMLFLVPQLLVPHLTGKWVTTANDTTCKDEQYQYVPQLHMNLTRVISWISMMVPWILYAVWSTATCVKLGKLMVMTAANKKARNQVGPTQDSASAVTAPTPTISARIMVSKPRAHVSGEIVPTVSGATITKHLSSSGNPRKLLRASAIMFGLVIALLVTYGPYTVVLVQFEIDANAVSFETFLYVLYLSYLNSLVDPFVVALTMPRLRQAVVQLVLGCAKWLVGHSSTEAVLLRLDATSTANSASYVSNKSPAWAAPTAEAQRKDATKKPTHAITLQPIVATKVLTEKNPTPIAIPGSTDN